MWRPVIKIFATACGLLLLLLFCGISLRTGIEQGSAAALPAPVTLEATLDLAHPPEFYVATNYPCLATSESPLLHELVTQGKLPPVAERVGPEPVVVRGFAGIGNYGGDWWQQAVDIDRVRLELQYNLNDSTFVRFSPYGEVQPHLARQIDHSDDYRTWTVHLRHGVRWSDGEPFTADDIIWWWQNVQSDPAVGTIPETMKVNGRAGSVEKVDDFTLRYDFLDPNPGWLAWQAGPSAALYMAGPRHYLEQFHPRLGNQELIRQLTQSQLITPRQLFADKNQVLNPDRPVLGPWMFRTYRSGGPWTAVRNPYYFVIDTASNQLPYMDRLVFRQVGEQLQSKTVTDGLLSFDLDTVDYTTLMNGRTDGHYEVKRWYPLDRARLCIVPNRRRPVRDGDAVGAAKNRLLQDKVFRRALSIAINRQAIIDAEFKGVGQPANPGPGPADPWYDPAQVRVNAQFDPAGANALLDSLGLTRRDGGGYRTLPDGSRLNFTLIVRPNQAGPMEFVVEDWAAVGLRVILQEKPHRLFMQSETTADFILFGDTNSTATEWGALGAGQWYWDWYYRGGMYGSPESRAADVAQPDATELQAMRAAQDAGNSPDPVEKMRLARDVMRLAQENVWSISIATHAFEPAVVKNGLRGVPDSLVAGFNYLTPNNAAPETWYWDNPQNINGDQMADTGYRADRGASISREILQSTPKPNGGGPAPVATAPSRLGKLLRVTLAGIVAVALVLIVKRHPFILRRLAIMIPTLVLISIIVYGGVSLPPGSYLDTIVENLERQGLREQARSELTQLREMYHLDDGKVKNYFRWTGLLWFTTYKDTDRGLLQGNLGRSMSNNGAPVSSLVGDRLLLTVTISIFTILLTWLIAIPIGVYSAVRQYSAADYVLTVGGFIGMCIPQFILALVLMLIAKSLFGITITGLFSNQYAMQNYWNWPKVVDLLKHLWLPVLVVGVSGTAGMVRVMRANLLDELRKPYVVTARAKGVRPLKLLVKYPFRMALIPFISGIGQLFPALVSGSAIVEIVLNLPTIGPLLLNAVMLSDTYMAGSLLLCLSALSVLGVLVSDLLLMAADPRIRMEGGAR